MYDPQVRYLRMLSNSVIAGLLARWLGSFEAPDGEPMATARGSS